MSATMTARVVCAECHNDERPCDNCDTSGFIEVRFPADEVKGLVKQHGMDGDITIVDIEFEPVTETQKSRVA